MSSIVNRLLRYFLPHPPSVIGAIEQSLLRSVVPALSIDAPFVNGNQIPIVEVTVAPREHWQEMPCCTTRISQEWFGWFTDALSTSTFATCPVCHSQLHPFETEEGSGHVIARIPPTQPVEEVRFGNSDAVYVYGKDGHLVVIRGIEVRVIDGKRLFIYSISEATRQRNYCFDLYDDARLSLGRNLSRYDDIASHKCLITRAFSRRSNSQSLSLPDFLELFRFLKHAQACEVINRGYVLARVVSEALYPLMLNGTLCMMLSHAITVCDAPRDVEDYYRLYQIQDRMISPESCDMDGSSSFASRPPTECKRFRRFDVS